MSNYRDDYEMVSDCARFPENKFLIWSRNGKQTLFKIVFPYESVETLDIDSFSLHVSEIEKLRVMNTAVFEWELDFLGNISDPFMQGNFFFYKKAES